VRLNLTDFFHNVSFFSFIYFLVQPNPPPAFCIAVICHLKRSLKLLEDKIESGVFRFLLEVVCVCVCVCVCSCVCLRASVRACVRLRLVLCLSVCLVWSTTVCPDFLVEHEE
jgi:hypothetical protein